MVSSCGEDGNEHSRHSGAKSTSGALYLDFSNPVENMPPHLKLITESVDEIEEVLYEVNSITTLHSNISIIFDNCDEGNAYYTPKISKITICIELLEEYFKIFSEESSSITEIISNTKYAMIDTLLHEVGHAIIRHNSFPVLGKEEDAADSFASYIAEKLDYGQKVILASYQTFKHRNNAHTFLPWGVHAPNIQRATNKLCFYDGIGGEIPEEFEDDLPEERKNRCKNEASSTIKDWDASLK
jgi:hypothetical protein